MHNDRMSEVVSNLFRVTVTLPNGRSWSVLVRAVDAESAAGAVRARGHTVTGVRQAERPKPGSRGTARTACMNCGYFLKQLPRGTAEEVQCPECGVINTSEQPDETVWTEFRRMHAPRRRKIGCAVILALLIVLGAAAYGAIAFLRAKGLMP